MVRRDTRALGSATEQLACRYLTNRGLEQVERNYRCRHGEIDLVMLDHDCLVFVEVRYRSATAFSSAALTVDRRKQSKLVRTAEMFLATRPGFVAHPTRFDVIGVDA
ncbi:MAG: YraN family protein, partial [Gammaproteobacteria bacterium]|nr:YraN family protein [Gammaproteobacteria bacterium]